MSAQAQLDAALGYCRAWNASDVDTLGSFLSDTSFSYRVLPTTLGPEVSRTHTKAELLVLAKGVFDNVVGSSGMNINFPPLDVVQTTDKIVLLLEDNGTKKSGEQYQFQYVFFITFVPGTNKITSVLEFQDSIYVAQEFAGWYDKAQGASQ